MTCPICQDTHWKSIEKNGVEVVVRCDCWRQSLVTRTLAAAGIPAGYQHCELSNFDARGANTLIRALSLAKKFATGFPVVEKGLFLLGPTGVGKTHLSVAILREVIRNAGARAFFYKAGELLQKIRNTYNASVDQTELEVLQPIFDAELLVLDDVGVGKPSEWAQETLGILIDKRYSSRQPTILTGNLNDASTPPDFFESVQYKLGPRTRSRLLEMCEFVVMESHDLREVGKDPTEDKIEEYNRRQRDLRQAGTAEPKNMAKARLRPSGRVDLKWTGGKAGS
jgi:DNA replication protein DnaC